MATLKRSLSLDNDELEDSVKGSSNSFQLKKRGRKGKVNKPNLSQKSQSSGKEVYSHNNSSPMDSNETCLFCKSSCDNTSAIQCDICEQYYHLVCCGVTESDVDIVLPIVKLLGWCCKACKSDTRKEIIKLKSEMIELKTSLSQVKIPVNNNQAIIPISNDVDLSSNIYTDKPTSQVSYAEVVKIVNKTVSETTQRKRNVVVSGLQERSGWDDGDLFSTLCQEHLNTKPRQIHNGTRRLGHSSGDKPRRLLVRLESEAAAAELLNSARNLRFSSDNYISRNIFINLDLTKEQSRLAYERREQKRRRGGVTAPGDGTDRPHTLTFINRSRYDANGRNAQTFVNPRNLVECTATNSKQLSPLTTPPTNVNSSTPPMNLNSLNPNAIVYQPPSAMSDDGAAIPSGGTQSSGTLNYPV